jgi:hypothetical protein
MGERGEIRESASTSLLDLLSSKQSSYNTALLATFQVTRNDEFLLSTWLPSRPPFPAVDINTAKCKYSSVTLQLEENAGTCGAQAQV